MSKISIVGISGLPAQYGGFETLAEQLVRNWPVEGDEFTCFCERRYSSYDINENNLRRIFLPLRANGPQSILFDALGILISIYHRNNTVLLLGVSGAWILPFVRHLPENIQPNIVTNVDGIEWKREKWGFFARKLLKYLEFLSVKYSNLVIADNQGVAEYLQKSYFIKPHEIAYGGDHVLSTQIPCSKRGVPKYDNFFFSVCRIVPENKVHLTLEAFKHIPDKNLIFVGNWTHSDYGKKLFEDYSNIENISLMHPIYDTDVLNTFRLRCDAFIHGHSAGGTNPSLVEYMFFGKPIIAFDCNFNRFTLRENGIFYTDEVTLSKEIKNLNCNSPSLGREIRATADKHYKWRDIIADYVKVLS